MASYMNILYESYILNQLGWIQVYQAHLISKKFDYQTWHKNLLIDKFLLWIILF